MVKEGLKFELDHPPGLINVTTGDELAKEYLHGDLLHNIHLVIYSCRYCSAQARVFNRKES